MLLRLPGDVLALQPAAVVVLAGTNDLEEQATPEQVAANFRLLIAALKKHRADLPVVICQVFPSSASKHRPAEKIKKINALLAGLVKTEPQVTLVDTWTLFANAEGTRSPKNSPTYCIPTSWATGNGGGP